MKISWYFELNQSSHLGEIVQTVGEFSFLTLNLYSMT